MAETSTPYDPSAASSLVMQSQFRSIQSEFYSTQANFSVAKRLDAGIGNQVVYTLEKRDGFSNFSDQDVRALIQSQTAKGCET